MIKVPKLMQNIFNLIDSIPEISKDIKYSVITLINSFDTSELSVTDIRAYIKYIKQEINKDSTTDQKDCYYRLRNKLNIERENRPFHEQFPEVDVSMKEMQLLATKLLESLKEQSSQITNLQRSSDKRDNELECYVNLKIRNYLKDGLIIASGYSYKGIQGESDGIIIGKNNYNEDVIVFVETKLDMDKEYKNAIAQSVRNVAHWELLLNMTKDDFRDPENINYKQDYDALNADKYRYHKIVRGFGGSKFQESTIKGRFKVLKGSLISVIKDNNQGDEIIYRKS